MNDNDNERLYRPADADGHFVHDLDDEPDRRPVYVDVVVRQHEQQPIVPAGLRPAQLPATVRRMAGRTGHRAGYHLVRLPVYAVRTAGWSVVGVGAVARRQVRWAWVTEQSALRQHAASGGDVTGWLQLHRELGPIRRRRLSLLGGELVAVVIGGAAVVLLAPWWAILLVVVGLAVPLARAGRPVGTAIVTPAIVTPRFRRLTPDVVLRALYAAGLGRPDKADQRVEFGSVMARDPSNTGSQVLVDLPYGRTFDDAMAARGKIASGLDVAVTQVFLTRDPSSHRRVMLWVADVDPLSVPAGPTPLLDCKVRDVWQPAPFGVDERNTRIGVLLLWISLLVGAQPRRGKTWSARLLGLFAALDPYAQLFVFDGKGGADWRRFSLVAERCAFGLAMTRDGDPIDILIDTLRELVADVKDRYRRLSEMPAAICPEGKLTRDIARDPQYRMPVRVLILDEFHEYFDLGEASKEIASLLVFLVKMAPAAGYIVIDATQKPSGVGTGDVAKQFTAFRDQHQARFALRTGSWQVSDLVLGSGAYGEGADSSALLPSHKGVGLLRGITDDIPTVRTYYASSVDAETILLAARRHREAAGTLSGMAAGESVEIARRDPLVDVRDVYVDGEAWLSWALVAARLAEQHPESYGGITAEAISATIRAAGVESRNGKVRGGGGAVARGPKRAEIDEAIERRQISGR